MSRAQIHDLFVIDNRFVHRMLKLLSLIPCLSVVIYECENILYKDPIDKSKLVMNKINSLLMLTIRIATKVGTYGASCH